MKIWIASIYFKDDFTFDYNRYPINTTAHELMGKIGSHATTSIYSTKNKAIEAIQNELLNLNNEDKKHFICAKIFLDYIDEPGNEIEILYLDLFGNIINYEFWNEDSNLEKVFVDKTPKYKINDIVEFWNGQEVNIGIINALPITFEEIQKGKRGDPVYLILLNNDDHEHISECFILKKLSKEEIDSLSKENTLEKRK